jgi:hypothetical protein
VAQGGDREAKRGNEEGREDDQKREHVNESVWLVMGESE